MVARNRARYLAPLALVATIIATVLVLQAGLGTKHHSSQAAPHHRAHGAFASARFYTVQPGDSLSAISTKTGIPVPTLETLNPSADPNALQASQRLRLRR